MLNPAQDGNGMATYSPETPPPIYYSYKDLLSNDVRLLDKESYFKEFTLHEDEMTVGMTNQEIIEES